MENDSESISRVGTSLDVMFIEHKVRRRVTEIDCQSAVRCLAQIAVDSSSRGINSFGGKIRVS